MVCVMVVWKGHLLGRNEFLVQFHDNHEEEVLNLQLTYNMLSLQRILVELLSALLSVTFRTHTGFFVVFFFLFFI